MANDDPTDPARLDALFAEFVAECDEHLSAARQGLLHLESFLQQGIDRAVADELFRNFHTIKGLAGMVGLRSAELLAHQMESYLHAIRQAKVQLTPAGIDALAAGISTLESIVAARHAQAPPPDLADVMNRFAGLANGTSATMREVTPEPSPAPAVDPTPIDVARHSGQPLWRITFRPSAELAERGINVNSVRARFLALGEVIHAIPQILPGGQIEFEFIVRSQADRSVFDDWQGDGITAAPYKPAAADISGQSNAEPARPAASSAPAHVPSNSVRVDLNKLDDVMRMVGDLVITRARYDDQLKRLRTLVPAPQWRALQEANLAFGRQIRDLREGVVRVRLVPVREIFGRMQFVVRDLARECDKEVALQLSGEETEVDKLVVERMMEPLLHLVRNAISHGIEPAKERVLAGKPAAATISLRAAAAGDTIVIEIEDDGRGINIADIAERARAAGLLSASAKLDDSALLDTICLPHFSTRDEADRASGRGLGMAIVKIAVEQLGGSLSIDTQWGRGTCFRILLPLTLAIADALIVRVGAQRFAIPQAVVREVIPLEPGSVTRLENNEVVSHRGSVVPLVRLATLFRRIPAADARSCALIVGEGRQALGMVVDHVLGLHEVVVRPLTDSLVRVPGISGATELGDGQVVLIVDAAETARLARGKIVRSRPAPIAAPARFDSNEAASP